MAFFVITGLGFALFFVTALFGRLWCGWACPYTVFLEHVYRRIERWIDGDAPGPAEARRRPVDRRRRSSGGCSSTGSTSLSAALIAHVFLSYFVSLPRLYGYMREAPLRARQAFGVVAFLTVVLYFCFAWFREQFCIIMCPYGRIQRALTDDDTVVIGYDEKRGEPRGQGKRSERRRLHRLPPLRAGLPDRHRHPQRPAARVHRLHRLHRRLRRRSWTSSTGRSGLVRYDSFNGFGKARRKVIRPRIVAYTVLMLVGLVALVLSLRTVKPFYTMATRMAGAPSYVTEDTVRNQFQLRVVNKRNREVTYRAAVVGLPEGGLAFGFEGAIVLPPQGEQAPGRFLCKSTGSITPGGSRSRSRSPANSAGR